MNSWQTSENAGKAKFAESPERELRLYRVLRRSAGIEFSEIGLAKEEEEFDV
jgi:hypothetical protein